MNIQPHITDQAHGATELAVAVNSLRHVRLVTDDLTEA
jgi:hypothetical protein